MSFNVNFSKRKVDKFYLPGQEIRISRGSFASKGFTTENDNVSVCRQRTVFALFCFVFAYIILGAKLSYVCLGNGINIDTAITDQNDPDVIRFKNPVKRADILDRNGEIIATSLPTVNLYANTKQIKHPKDVAEKLNFIFPEISYDRFMQLLRRRGAFIYLKRNLSPQQQLQVNNLGIPGLEFENCEKRIYPHKNLFAHVLGNTDVDNVGIAGIEKSMNERLTSSTKPLYLSLDIGVQNTIRKELLEGVKKFNAAGAAAILMDAKTGRIVALTSVPDFDPNQNLSINLFMLFNNFSNEFYCILRIFNWISSCNIRTSTNFIIITT